MVRYGSRHSNLLARCAASVVLGPLVMALAAAGCFWASLAVVPAAAAAAREWHRLARPSQADTGLAAPACAVLGPLAALSIAACLPASSLAERAACGYGLALLSACFFVRPSPLLAAGVAYAGVFATAIVVLAWHPGWVLGWLLAVVWASDIGAYATGRLAGGPRMAPTVSPGKTWSGMAGAVTWAAAAGGLWGTPVGGALAGMALGGALGALGQCGDLLESALKRRAGCKDSGSLIPGHGGLLDRIDALMACAPALLFFLVAAAR